MKNIENLTKYYGDFTPMERLNLLIASIVRSDNAEVEKLIKTCPRRHYTQRDAAFTDRYHCLIDVSNIFITQFQTHCDIAGTLLIIFLALKDQITIYEWAIELIEQDETKKDALVQAKEEINGLECLTAKINEKYKQQIISIKSLLEAYRQFCREVGVQEEKALKWVETVNSNMVHFVHLENIGIDEELLCEMKDSFYKIWRSN